MFFLQIMETSTFTAHNSPAPQTVPLMHPKTFPLTHTSTQQVSPQPAAASPPVEKDTSALVEMLNRVDEFDQIPRIQVDDQARESGRSACVASASSTPTVFIQIPVSNSQGLVPLQVPVAGQEISMGTSPAAGVNDCGTDKGNKKGDKQPWHYHLGEYTLVGG